MKKKKQTTETKKLTKLTKRVEALELQLTWNSEDLERLRERIQERRFKFPRIRKESVITAAIVCYVALEYFKFIKL